MNPFDGIWLFLGVLAAYFLIDRKIDRKIAKYLQKIKTSSEGQDAIKILKETRKLLEGTEVKDMVNEAKEMFSETRVILKKMKERFEPSSEEEDEEEEAPVLPTLG